MQVKTIFSHKLDQAIAYGLSICYGISAHFKHADWLAQSEYHTMDRIGDAYR